MGNDNEEDKKKEEITIVGRIDASKVSWFDIGKAFSRLDSMVQGFRDGLKAGRPKPEKDYIRERRERVWKLYQMGVPQAKIAEAENVSIETVKDDLRVMQGKKR